MEHADGSRKKVISNHGRKWIQSALSFGSMGVVCLILSNLEASTNQHTLSSGMRKVYTHVSSYSDVCTTLLLKKIKANSFLI